MLEIGKLNELRIVKKLDFGLFVDGEELGEILLPKRYVPEDCKINDLLEVFLYYDSEDRIIATTLTPYAMVGQFALLNVVSVTAVGAFLNWGLLKDLLAPFGEQKRKMNKGKSYIVYVYIDEYSKRIVASSKLERFLDKEPVVFKELQEVDLLIFDESDMGYSAIINNTHRGIIYKNEVFQPLRIGQKIKGYIKKVRDDNKIDLSIYKPGYQKIDDLSQNVLDYIKLQNGFIPLNDKSSPELIYELFGISKKSFKKSLGALYKSKIVTIDDDGIRLRDGA